jgi:hypothetical protein
MVNIHSMGDVAELPPLVIYICGASRAGPLKVGVTRDKTGRLRALKTGNARRLKMIWSCVCKNPAWERHVHLALSPWRLEGEWFAVPIEKAMDALFTVIALDTESPGPSELNTVTSDFWPFVMEWPDWEKFQ